MNENMIKVTPFEFKKEMEVPTSKSYANRLLVLAAISKNPVTLKSISDSTDVQTMLKCLEAIGVECIKEGSNVTIRNSFPECESKFTSSEPVVLDTGDGGTTNRFLLALLARGKRTYILNAAEGIRKRPINELTDVLINFGVHISVNKESDPFWLELRGPYKNSTKDKQTVLVDSKRSTQFITALSLALADNEDITFKAKDLENSQKYFDLTLSLIDHFNKNQNIDSYQVPVDFSSLSYPLGLALMDGEVLVTNCYSQDTFQADAIFLDFIKEMGGKLEFRDTGLFLKKTDNLKPLDVDCSSFPDLVPTLAFVCSYIDGTSILRNLNVLHYKESDRVEEIIKVLQLFEVNFQYDKENEVIKITGKKDQKVDFKEICPPPDHRIIMMSYLFMRKNSGGMIQNAHHVNKSFPDFFNIFN